MGGDGGTISSNRAYLRGAGKADHTADHKRYAASRTKEEETETARTTLRTCAISGEVLNLSPRGDTAVSAADIVACPYGRLYKRENVLEALLMRSCGKGEGERLKRIVHIRGRKDLHPVRFNVVKLSNEEKQQKKEREDYLSTCPITGSEIGGGSVPAFLVVRSSSSSNNGDVDNAMPNVISERAIQEMGVEKLQDEYGPFEKKDLIRLAPSNSLFEGIRKNWEEQVEAERLEKLNKKKEKKRKKADDPTNKTKSKPPEQTELSPKKSSSTRDTQPRGKHEQQSTQAPSAAQEARSTVQSAVESNPILSNLFGSKKNSSEKERRDALFTRNC